MKQKIVIKVTMNKPNGCWVNLFENDPRSKALKIAVGVSGVESVGFGGQDKSQIEVVGNEVDAVELTNLLRKKVGYAEIASVAAVGDKKEDLAVQPVLWSTYGGGIPHTYVYPVQSYRDPSCSIM